MLLRTRAVACVVLAPKKAPGKYAKPANKSAKSAKSASKKLFSLRPLWPKNRVHP